MESKNPTLADQHVGRRMRWRRKELNLSQQELADRLGITFQQVQKYERGANRVSAGRLWELAKALETQTTFFFDGLEAVSAAVRRGMAEDPAEFTGLIDADSVDLVTAYQHIRDPELRKSILAMVKKQAKLFRDNPPPPKKKR